MRFYDLQKETGAMVLSVEDESPAKRAGLREGDIIVALEGQPVAGVDDLHRLLTEVRVGVSCVLTVLRWTEKLELKVVPEEARVNLSSARHFGDRDETGRRHSPTVPDSHALCHCQPVPLCVSLFLERSLCTTKYPRGWIVRKAKFTGGLIRRGSPDISQSSWMAMGAGQSGATCHESPDTAPESHRCVRQWKRRPGSRYLP